MTICSPTSKAVSPALLLLAIVLAFSLNARGQTSAAPDQAKPKATPTPSLEKKFFSNILKDQGAIWTSPFHLHEKDAKWLAPLGLSTVALIATDRSTARELAEHGDNLNRLRISRQISKLGSLEVTGGFAGILYLTGRATNNNHLRETGLLSAEALIDSGILVTALKTASQRPRPMVDNSSGEFFDGGKSFPSGHASSAWSVATVVAPGIWTPPPHSADRRVCHGLRR